MEGTWQRSRSVLRFLSKLLPSLLLWWLRMWKTAKSFKQSVSSKLSLTSFKITIVVIIINHINVWSEVCRKDEIEHCTKIWGHSEGESTLGASVACWKAASWGQADLDILLWSILKGVAQCPYLSMALKGCLTRLLCVGVSRRPRIDLNERASPGLEEKAVGRPKG